MCRATNTHFFLENQLYLLVLNVVYSHSILNDECAPIQLKIHDDGIYLDQSRK